MMTIRHKARCLVCTVLTLAACAGVTSSAAGQERVKGFGRAAGDTAVRGFGRRHEQLPEVNVYDLNSARQMISKVDKNRDGEMTVQEMTGTKYAKYIEPMFYYDLNSDGVVTQQELAFYYAKIRIDNNQKQRANEQNVRNIEAMLAGATSSEVPHVFLSGISVEGSESIQWVDSSGSFSVQDAEQLEQIIVQQLSHDSFTFLWSGNPTGQQAAQILLQQYDRDGSATLDTAEAQLVAGRVLLSDTNHDGHVTLEELAEWIGDKLPPFGSKAPEWFRNRDLNRDRQLTLREYAGEIDRSRLERFEKHDRNGDGLLTADEAASMTPHPLKETASTKTASDSTIAGEGHPLVYRRFVDQDAHILSPGRNGEYVISIPEDLPIDDLRLELSLWHPKLDQFSAELVGPNGHSIVLFDGAGKNWEGQSFRKTRLDDSASTSMADLPNPIPERIRPANATESGLKSFCGSPSRGVWRLKLKGERSEYAGSLQRWAIVVGTER